MVTLDEKDARSDWNVFKSEGFPVLCHFLSAALRFVHSDRRVSLSQGWDWEV